MNRGLLKTGFPWLCISEKNYLVSKNMHFLIWALSALGSSLLSLWVL